MTTTIRPANLVDTENMARTLIASWQWAYRSILPDDFLDSMSLEYETENMRKKLSYPGWNFWVAEKETDIIGIIGCSPPHQENMPAPLRVCSFYLHPASARQGIGAQLWNSLADHARSLHIPTLYLMVMQSNTIARGFYEKQGCIPHAGEYWVDFDGRVSPQVDCCYIWHI